LEAGGDVESLIGDVTDQDHLPWHQLGANFGQDENLFPHDPTFDDAFEQEFDELDELKEDASNQGQSELFRARALDVRAILENIRADCLGSYRCSIKAMARQIEALPDLVFSRQADIQSTWRRPIDHQLHWHHSNPDFLLPRGK
jgi:hypothetical protein